MSNAELNKKFREGFAAGHKQAIEDMRAKRRERDQRKRKLAALKDAAPMSKEYADAKRES